MHDTIIRYIKVATVLVFTGAVMFVVLEKIWGASVTLGAISLDTTDVLSIVLARLSEL